MLWDLPKVPRAGEGVMGGSGGPGLDHSQALTNEDLEHSLYLLSCS